MIRNLRRPRYLIAAATVLALSTFGLVNANAAVTYYTYRNTTTDRCLASYERDPAHPTPLEMSASACSESGQSWALIPVGNGWSHL